MVVRNGSKHGHHSSLICAMPSRDAQGSGSFLIGPWHWCSPQALLNTGIKAAAGGVKKEVTNTVRDLLFTLGAPWGGKQPSQHQCLNSGEEGMLLPEAPTSF